MAVSQSISLTQGVQSIDENNTQVTFTWTSTQTGESWNGYTKTAYYYVSINGGAETTYSVSYTLPKSSTKTIASETFTVYHNNDGTGSISIRTWMDTGISAGVVQKSASLTLTTIPRASKINSFTGTNLDGNFSVGYTSYSSSFTNKLRISVPNVKALETFNYTSGTSFKLSQASLKYLYSYTGNTDKVQLGAVIETWNGSTKIGESAESIHYCYVPSNIKPSLGEISIDPANITTVDGTSRDILVQEKNKITVSVSSCRAGSGSSIKNYKFEVLSGTTVIQTVTITSAATSASASLGPFSKTGTLKFRLTVTDNRGRYDTNKEKELTYTCHEYGPPSFLSFNAYRCNSSGVADDDGTCIKYDLGVDYKTVDNTNNSTVKIYYKTSSATNWTAAQNALTNSTTKTASEIIKNTSGTNVTFDAESTYIVYATVTDNYNGSVKSSSITVFGASKVFNIRSNGSGIAFGKMAESDNLFECKWPAKFDDDIEFKGQSLIDLIYPVGSIYLSVNSVNPSTYLGGTWEQLQDRFLLGAGNTYKAGDTGGEATHILVENEMPIHDHSVRVDWTNEASTTNTVSVNGVAAINSSVSGRLGIDRSGSGTGERGGGKAHNNMPPYLAVFMWKRTK